MSFQLEDLPALTVMGIHTVASNAEPHKIGDLWRRFHAMGNGTAIPARLNDDHYCVYCEYEGDWTNPFTVVVGCAVDAAAEVPEGMKKVSIEAGKFAVLRAEGELPQGVFDVWAEVWRTPFDRRYEADYDRYSANGATVHVGGFLKVQAKGLLFDMDGVLISSIGSVIRSWRIWTKEYGIPWWETYDVPHGKRAIDIVRELRPDLDEPGVLAGLRAIEDIEMEDTADLVVLPGARELLESLPPERWSIVTSATRRLLLGRLEAAGLPVPTRIIAADDVVNGKPHPEPYMTGAKLLGFDPSDCIVFEDAPAGVGAGAAAGSRVIGVLGTHTAEELSAASWIVSSLLGVTAQVSGDGLELEFDPL